MSNKIKTDRNGNLSIAININNMLVYVKNANYEGIALKYKVGNSWYYQHLMLGVRGGAMNYFKAAKDLYNHLRRNKITQTTFRRLAV